MCAEPRGIDLKSLDDTGAEYVPAALARGFAAAGGVAAAVKALAPEMKDMVINGLDKTSIRVLKSFAKSSEANFVEVMSCENGCIGGCNVISNPKVAARQLKEAMKNARSIDQVSV